MNPKTPFYYHDLIYYIKVENKTILTEKPKTKKIYLNMLKHVGRDHIITGEKLWKNKIQNLNFAEIWKNTFFLYWPPHDSDLLYKVLHYAIKANNYTYKCSRDKKNITPYCNYCKQAGDILHLFTTCYRIQKFWKHYQPYYNKLLKTTYTPDQHI